MAQLHSTLGRIIGRTVHCCELQDILQNQYSALITNIGKGDHTTFVKPNIPATGEFKGVGFLEAPRGMLSHWMVIKDGIISNYQAVVPSTWNSGPRNFNDDVGPYEQSLVGTPVADPNKPLEVVRTIHSFDHGLCGTRSGCRRQRSGFSEGSVMRILVLGVGNILLTDEAIGVRIVEALEQRYILPDYVEILDGGTAGMELLGDMANRDHLIIADAIVSKKNAPGNDDDPAG